MLAAEVMDLNTHEIGSHKLRVLVIENRPERRIRGCFVDGSDQTQ